MLKEGDKAPAFTLGGTGGSAADGHQLKDVHWPAGCTLVAIRRGRAVLVPEGNTVLQDGDIVTAFGASGVRREVLDRLHATLVEETPGSDPDPA